MTRLRDMAVALAAAAFLSGCETTNSIPYKASTSNVIAIQQNLSPDNSKLNVGDLQLATGLDEKPT